MTIDAYTNKKILVTGGAGHIGSHLIKNLLRSNPKAIVSIDDYSNGIEANHHQGCTYIAARTTETSSALGDEFYDYVFHFGEYARVEQSFEHIDYLIEQNIIGTKRVFDYFLRNNCGKLIYSCSSAIFSTDEPGLVQSPYSIFKKCNRDLLLTLKAMYNLNVAVLYFSNVYGGAEKGIGSTATVVAKFLEAKKNKKSVVINGSGNQRRNFTYIDDAIEGVKLVAEKGDGDGYVIAAEESISILELAKMIGVDFEFGTQTFGNRQKTNLDLSKMNALGWKSKTQLTDYLSKALKNVE